MIGVNAKSSAGSEAKLIGHTRNPFVAYDPSPNTHLSVEYVVICLVAMFIGGAVYYFKQIKIVNMKEKTLSLEEYEKESARFGINESLNESQDPHYLNKTVEEDLEEV